MDKFTASWADTVAGLVPGFKAMHLLLRENVVAPKRIYDLDDLMTIRGCQGIISHTTLCVAFAMFSTAVCQYLHQLFCSRLGLSIHPNCLFLSG